MRSADATRHAGVSPDKSRNRKLEIQLSSWGVDQSAVTFAAHFNYNCRNNNGYNDDDTHHDCNF